MTKPQKHAFMPKNVAIDEYTDLAATVILGALQDALWLVVPQYAEEHLRKSIPYVSYQKNNPNPMVSPWTREVIDARHWLLNESYDEMLEQESLVGTSSALTFSECCRLANFDVDTWRARIRAQVKTSQDAEINWTLSDIDTVKYNISMVTSTIEEHKKEK